MRVLVRSIVSAVVLLAGLADAARANPTPEAAVAAFWRCFAGAECPAERVFAGDTALDLWERARGKLSNYLLLDTRLVPRAPGDKFPTRWGPAVEELAAAGYDGEQLAKLGAGEAIVLARPEVAVALASATFREARRGLRTEHVLLVLWRQDERWRIAMWEDSATSLVRFLKDHLPATP